VLISALTQWFGMVSFRLLVILWCACGGFLSVVVILLSAGITARFPQCSL